MTRASDIEAAARDARVEILAAMATVECSRSGSGPRRDALAVKARARLDRAQARILAALALPPDDRTEALEAVAEVCWRWRVYGDAPRWKSQYIERAIRDALARLDAAKPAEDAPCACGGYGYALDAEGHRVGPCLKCKPAEDAPQEQEPDAATVERVAEAIEIPLCHYGAVHPETLRNAIARAAIAAMGGHDAD